MFEIVSLWGRAADSPGFARGKTSMVSESGSVAFEMKYDVDLRERHRVRTICQVLGFPPIAPGDYYFRVEYSMTDENGWTEAARVPFVVRGADQGSENTRSADVR